MESQSQTQSQGRSVSRCVAIAAHGKRCQQSPFRGSPYCWHHTQSRKVWAPSRPLGSGSRPSAPAPTAGDGVPAGPNGRPVAAPIPPGSAVDGAAHRLAERLGPERVEELLAFLESPDDGAYLLVRDAGVLLSERSVSQPPARRRRSA